jgi:hypothetical protein
MEALASWQSSAHAVLASSQRQPVAHEQAWEIGKMISKSLIA